MFAGGLFGVIVSEEVGSCNSLWMGRCINYISVLRGLKYREFVESHFHIRYIALDMLDGVVVGLVMEIDW